MKNNIKLIFCFLGIILSLLGSIFFFFMIEDYLALRIIVLIMGFILSFFIFILSSKFKRLEVVKEDENQTDLKVIKNRKYAINKLRCPNCHKPYDGDNCFYCGFKR